MNDEGATHYSGVIENLGLGHRLLNDTFGQCGLPRVGWQVGGPVTSNKEPFFLSQKVVLVLVQRVYLFSYPSSRLILSGTAKSRRLSFPVSDLTDSSLPGSTGATR